MLNSPILRWARKRKLLDRNPPMYCSCSNCERINEMNEEVLEFTKKFMRYLIITIVSLIAACVLASVVNADVITVQGYTNKQICNAIFQAEGGLNTKHPYGIIPHYKHTTPRQACLNTIKHLRYNWNVWAVQHGKYKNDFINYLGARYAPVGATNDPQGLNKNWVKLVKFFLNKQKNTL